MKVSSTPLISLDALVLDTETTGLDPKHARVIQIGAVPVRAGEVILTEPLDVLINPEQPIPPKTIKIHGITDDDVKDAEIFSAAESALERIEKANVIVGHNVGFDLAILKSEYERAGRAWPEPRSLDTLLLARIASGILPDYSLDTVANWLGIEIENRHTGLGDAIATAQIFVAMLPHLAPQGIRTLAEAEEASRAFSDVLEAHESQGWQPPVRVSPDVEQTAFARIDSYPYRHRVQEIMSTPPLVIPSDTTIETAARILCDKGVSSVFVKSGDKAEKECGIVTERDLMRALTARERGAGQTVGQIMSQPLKTIGEGAFLYQAIARMQRAGIRHLGVDDSAGKLVGALTTGDLLRQRASDAILLGDEIRFAKDTPALAAAWARLPEIALSLLKEDVHPLDITSVIAEELCGLTKRAAELAEKRMRKEGRGEPPQPYTVLVLGSAGRGETMLAPDQDNAIVYEAGDPGGAEDQWFETLGHYMADTLNSAGLPFCNGGVMAKNQGWRHSLEHWKKAIDHWLGRADTKDIFHVDIFYDFRAVHGSDQLANDLRSYAYAHAHRAPGFLRQLAAIATDFRSPIGIFGSIKTTHGRVDLKKTGTMPVVSGARMLALRHGVEQRATRQRLAGVRDLGGGNEDDLNNLIEAHEIFLKAILRQQLMDIDIGIPPSNKVEVKRLEKREYERIRWALRQTEAMVSLIGDPMAFG